MNISARSNNPNALQLKALYDYVPDNTFEGNFLTFKAGDIITLTEKCEGGWYKGTLNNNEGMFPPTYCEELPPRRLMNVDTKKTSPTIKRMQTLLKLTVTGSGDKVEEVEQEGEIPFTRERAQSDAHMFAYSAKNSLSARPTMREVAQKVIEGKRLLELHMSGRGREEHDSSASDSEEAPPPVSLVEPVVKEKPVVLEKPAESPEVVELKKRISELETEKYAMIEEYKNGREKLHEEFSQKISLLHDLLDEKGLIIEIMKKDLEIKAEENKEITIELELEIERLSQSCADLEKQVFHLTPLEGDIISPRDTRPLPALPKPPNPPTPRIGPKSSRPRNAPDSPMPSRTSPAKPPAEVLPLLESPSSSPLSPSPAEQEEISPEDSTPAKAIPSLLLAPPPPQPLSASTNIPVPISHPPPPRYKSFPSLSVHPYEMRPPVSPRSSATPRTPRIPNSPRVLFSSTLLEPPNATRTDSRSKIPNLDSSLAKLAELGAHPHQPSLALEVSPPHDPEAAEKEIAELKKRIAELEAERLHAIEEYISKKATAEPISPSLPASSPSTTSTTNTTSPSLSVSSSQVRSTTPPPLPPVPILPVSNLNKSTPLPPVPLPPSLTIAPAPTPAPTPMSPVPTSPPPATLSSSSSLSSSPTVAQSRDKDPPSSFHARPTRSRNRDRGPNGPTPNTNKENERPKKEVSSRLTWLQASLCVAVGSVAFYLVETIFYKYM